MNNIKEFINELPFTIEYFQPDSYALSLAGKTSSSREFSLYLDFYWEIYYAGEVFSWDNEDEIINSNLQRIIGVKVVDILGPDNVYDATYILEDGGMIRALTSDNEFATEWSLTVVGEGEQLFAGEIYPYELSALGTDFTQWDALYTPVILSNKKSFPHGLIGTKISSLNLLENDHSNRVLEIYLQKNSAEKYKIQFWNSWAFYSDKVLLMDNATKAGVLNFASIAQGETLQGYTGSGFGLYGCSLVFDSLRLRQIGSSEPAWTWRILDDKGNLLWRAPTDAEANQGLIDGVENPVL